MYACAQFKNLLPEKRLAKVRKYNLCLNCLRQGHYASQCKATRRCAECGGKHHSLLHHKRGKNEEDKATSEKGEAGEEESVANHHTNSRQRGTLLMTCQVMIRGSDGSFTQARALLDSGSEASFITERLAQQLRLSRHWRDSQVQCNLYRGIHARQKRTKGLLSVRNTDTSQAGEVNLVKALVLPNITLKTPAYPVHAGKIGSISPGLSLADPDCGAPGAVDLPLGADIFSRVVLHGRQFRPSGSRRLLRRN